MSNIKLKHRISSYGTVHPRSEHAQCNPCFGRGYKVRYRDAQRGLRIEAYSCPVCSGVGIIPITQEECEYIYKRQTGRKNERGR